jgi:transcriptional regulator with XRE-family HTH domain
VNTIAERLKYARIRAGMTQKELAEKAHVTVDTIAQTEAGRSERPRRLPEIAAALEVSPGWLAFGDERIDKLTRQALEIAEAFDQAPEATRRAIALLLTPEE